MAAALEACGPGKVRLWDPYRGWTGECIDRASIDCPTGTYLKDSNKKYDGVSYSRCAKPKAAPPGGLQQAIAEYRALNPGQKACAAGYGRLRGRKGVTSDCVLLSSMKCPDGTTRKHGKKSDVYRCRKNEPTVQPAAIKKQIIVAVAQAAKQTKAMQSGVLCEGLRRDQFRNEEQWQKCRGRSQRRLGPALPPMPVAGVLQPVNAAAAAALAQGAQPVILPSAKPVAVLAAPKKRTRKPAAAKKAAPKRRVVKRKPAAKKAKAAKKRKPAAKKAKAAPKRRVVKRKPAAKKAAKRKPAAKRR